MDEQIISTSLAPEVILGEIHGNLQVKGWDQPEVAVKARPEDLEVNQDGDQVRINCRSNCEVRLPSGAGLQVESVGGEARIKYLQGTVKIGEVRGSLELRNVGGAQVETVQGELIARQVGAALKVEAVSGNATVWEVQGDCWLEEVKGNLQLRSLDGGLNATVQGNAQVSLSAVTGAAYCLEAAGNVRIRLPENASLALELSSKARNISVRLPGESRVSRQETLNLTLGAGEVKMVLSAGGNLDLSAREVDWSDLVNELADVGEATAGLTGVYTQQLAQQIESQVEAQMELLSQQLNEHMDSLSSSLQRAGVSEAEAENILRRARQSSERVAARAQEKIRRTQEKLERKLEAAHRRSEARAQSADSRGQARSSPRSWSFSGNPPAPAPEAQPPSEEERLLVLRMLEQKKITLEQAETLLAALEGGGS